MARSEDGSAVDLSIVIPIHNEEDSIKLLYGQLKEVLGGLDLRYEIVFVNDGSTDRSPEILRKISSRDPCVRVLELSRNFGQGPALAAGFDYAKADVIISMDGDLQHDPRDIPAFFRQIEQGYDIVSGWREDRKDPFFSRRLPSKVANWLMAKLSGVPIHDFGTTFKAYRARALDDVQLYSGLHRFIPALASWGGVKIIEIPIRNEVRAMGSSHYGLRRVIQVFFDLIMLKFLLSYSTKPLVFFGFPGVACTMLGLLVYVFLFYRKFFQGVGLMDEHAPLMIIGTLLTIVGFQFLCFGILAEILVRIYFEARDRKVYRVANVIEGGEDSTSLTASLPSEKRRPIGKVPG